MTTGILAAVTAALGSVGAYFAWKNSALRRRRQAEREVAAAHAAFDRKKAEIEAAVYGRDDAKLNEIVRQLLEDQ